jgi:hypothetical protein
MTEFHADKLSCREILGSFQGHFGLCNNDVQVSTISGSFQGLDPLLLSCSCHSFPCEFQIHLVEDQGDGGGEGIPLDGAMQPTDGTRANAGVNELWVAHGPPADPTRRGDGASDKS